MGATVHDQGVDWWFVRGVTVKIFHQATADLSGYDGASPLINGPRGYCLDLTNPTGVPVEVTVSGRGATPLTFVVGAGDPVTSGPGRSLTATQMAAFGYSTRGDLGPITVG